MHDWNIKHRRRRSDQLEAEEAAIRASYEGRERERRRRVESRAEEGSSRRRSSRRGDKDLGDKLNDKLCRTTLGL